MGPRKRLRNGCRRFRGLFLREARAGIIPTARPRPTPPTDCRGDENGKTGPAGDTAPAAGGGGARRPRLRGAPQPGGPDARPRRAACGGGGRRCDPVQPDRSDGRGDDRGAAGEREGARHLQRRVRPYRPPGCAGAGHRRLQHAGGAFGRDRGAGDAADPRRGAAGGRGRAAGARGAMGGVGTDAAGRDGSFGAAARDFRDGPDRARACADRARLRHGGALPRHRAAAARTRGRGEVPCRRGELSGGERGAFAARAGRRGDAALAQCGADRDAAAGRGDRQCGARQPG